MPASPIHKTKKLFISRDLDAGSSFVNRLSGAGVEVTGQSLIRFTPIPFTKVPDADWIFFYSKQGIRYYFDRLDDPSFWSTTRVRLPRKVKEPRYATFGEGSARFLKEFRNIRPDFTGTGEAKSTAIAFLQKISGERVLFVRGRRSLRSVQKILQGDLNHPAELIAYDNEPMTHFTLPQCHYLLFTSPLNARAWYGRYRPKSWQKVFAIGQSTAKALLSLGIEKVTVAGKPSLDELAEVVIESL